MGNINLQELIDQVMGMAKDSMEMRKKLSAGSQLSGNDITQMRNNAIDDDLRKQRGILELQNQKNTGLANVQSVKNEGSLDVAGMRSSGNRSSSGSASGGGGEDGDKLIIEMIKANPTMTADDVLEARKKLRMSAPADLSKYETPDTDKMVNMSDAEFRDNMTKINPDNGRRGVGYIEDANGGNQIRVIDNEVYGGREISAARRALSAPVVVAPGSGNDLSGDNMSKRFDYQKNIPAAPIIPSSQPADPVRSILSPGDEATPYQMQNRKKLDSILSTPSRLIQQPKEEMKKKRAALMADMDTWGKQGLTTDQINKNAWSKHRDYLSSQQ